MVMTKAIELNELELERVAGGKVNPNMDPGKLPSIDKIINGKFRLRQQAFYNL